MAVVVNGVSAGTIAFPTTNGSWKEYADAEIDVELNAGVNTLSFVSLSSDGGPNIDMFTFGIDGVEIYDGTQTLKEKDVDEESKDKPKTSLPVVSLKGFFHFDPSTGALFTPRAGFVEVYFYDMSGAMRMGVSRNVSAGSTMVPLDKEMLPEGTYFINVKLDGKMMQKGTYKKF